jgi:hypothetical protein
MQAADRARVTGMTEESHDPDFIMNPGEKTTILFTQMIFQLSSLASMLLGKFPHPETGETKRDLEAAQVIIDQLEMLETKTKGNLNKDEEQLLKQTLMSLRMAYVEEVNRPKSQEPAESSKKQPTDSAVEQPADAHQASPPPESSSSEESKKRFSKKY